VADLLSVFSKSIREMLLRPEDFFTVAHPQAHRRGISFVFEADARALRKRLPPKQTITIEKCTCLVSTRSAPGDLSGKQMSQFMT
jgi:hypothetical protein